MNHIWIIMLKRHNILPTRTSYFISSAGRIESVQEFKVKPFEQLFHFFFFFFFYLGFLSRTFTIQETAGEGGGYLFNSSLPFTPASQTLRHQPGVYCRELTSVHSQQPDSNQEPLISERKSLTTKLRVLFHCR